MQKLQMSLLFSTFTSPLKILKCLLALSCRSAFESAYALVGEVHFSSNLFSSDIWLVKLILSWKNFLAGLCGLIPLYLGEWHEERRACKKQNRPKKFWNTTGGVRPNQWMQMPSPHQPRVPPWLRMPRMCGTNPQDLVCFPPHLPSALNSSPHLPCLSCCAQFFHCPEFFFSSHLIFYVRIQLPPMTFFPLICSVAPAHFHQFSIRLYFQQFDC